MNIFPVDLGKDVYKKHAKCLRCQAPLEGQRGWKYCSQRCSKLYLKSAYRSRNREKINAYNRKHRSQGSSYRLGYTPSTATVRAVRKLYDHTCANCGSEQNLQLAHIKPHWASGHNRATNFILFCQPCHYQFDKALRQFWQPTAI